MNRTSRNIDRHARSVRCLVIVFLCLSLFPVLAEDRPSWARPEGFFTEEVIKREVLAPGLEWISASGKLGALPIQSEILSVDLSLFQLKPLIGSRILSNAAYFPRSTVSGLRSESAALAAINASFFDIKATQSPSGLVVIDRRLLRNSEAWSPVLFLKPQQAALVERVTWQADLRVGEQKHPLGAVNAPSLKQDEIALYVSPWQRTLGAGFIKEESILEIVVKEIDWAPAYTTGQSSRLKGRVSEVRENAPSRPLEKGEFVLASRSHEDAILCTVKVGDPVEVEWSLGNTPEDWTQWLHAISGNRILVWDGAWQPRDEKERRHPRTAVGINREGNQVLLVMIDGRSPLSAGVESNELGRYLHHLGAHAALNLDGGGSSAMSAIVNGEARLLNRPSDEKERFVPTGVGVFAK